MAGALRIVRFLLAAAAACVIVGTADRASLATAGQIQGTKYNDLDRDGLFDAGEPGLQGWMIYLDSNNNSALDTATTQVQSVDVPRNIPDEGMVTSTLTVTGLTGELLDVNVTVDITHTWDEDLQATLTSPTGTSVELFSGVGGSGENFADTTLDDEAAKPIRAGTAPFAGSYRPQGPLSVLRGSSPNGTWKLQVADLYEGDEGSLNSWSLTLTVSTEPIAVTSATGAYSFTNLTPGTYIVREVQQAEWRQTAPLSGFHSVPVASGQTVSGINFGNRVQKAEIHGTKWNDLNGDGLHDLDETGLKDWTIYIDRNNNGVLDLGGETRTVNATDVPVDIPDGDTAVSTMEVAGLPGVIADVNVTLNITHTWVSDLEVFLIGPKGITVELFTEVGDDGQNFTNTTLDDEAATEISSGTAPFPGSFRPASPLSALDGQNPNGTWTLVVTDLYTGDAGTLNSWSITITTESEPSALTDANGEYALTNLAAGTYTVREVQQAGWTQTSPIASGVRLLAATGAEGTNPYTLVELLTDPPVETLIGGTLFGPALDFDPAGVLYGAYMELMIIDPATGADTFIGSIASATLPEIEIASIAFAPDGTLYGVSVDNVLYTIDKATAFATEIGLIADDYVWGIDFAPDGTLYGAQYNLVKLDPATAQVIETVGELLESGVTDIDFAPDGFIYAVTWDTMLLYRVDPADASSTLIGVYESEFWGIASQPLPGGRAGSHTVVLAPGQILTGIDFLNRQLLGEIHGACWHDVNCNGAQDASEPPLQGWTVLLDDGESSAVTDNSGNYVFAKLPAGDHVVALAVQTDWLKVYPTNPPVHNVTLTPGQIIEHVDFAARLTGDINADGCVNVADLLIVRNSLGKTGSSIHTPPWPDENRDDICNIADLLTVRNRLGKGSCK